VPRRVSLGLADTSSGFAGPSLGFAGPSLGLADPRRVSLAPRWILLTLTRIPGSLPGCGPASLTASDNLKFRFRQYNYRERHENEGIAVVLHGTEGEDRTQESIPA